MKGKKLYLPLQVEISSKEIFCGGNIGHSNWIQSHLRFYQEPELLLNKLPHLTNQLDEYVEFDVLVS